MGFGAWGVSDLALEETPQAEKINRKSQLLGQDASGTFESEADILALEGAPGDRRTCCCGCRLAGCAEEGAPGAPPRSSMLSSSSPRPSPPPKPSPDLQRRTPQIAVLASAVSLYVISKTAGSSGSSGTAGTVARSQGEYIQYRSSMVIKH